MRGPETVEAFLTPIATAPEWTAASLPKAVIFDVYHTLLKVSAGPSPQAAEAGWESLCAEYLPNQAGQTMAEFDRICRIATAQDHAIRKAQGTRWPEVDWTSVAVRAAPGLGGLEPAAQAAFLVSHARLQRRTESMPGALSFIRSLSQRGILAGIASNAQPYTLGEMRAAGINPDIFDPGLCFWSFAQGFSKPDPAVFEWLTTQLARRDIHPHEILMIGDRIDNDIAPAAASGWQTWHFSGIWPSFASAPAGLVQAVAG